MDTKTANSTADLNERLARVLNAESRSDELKALKRRKDEEARTAAAKAKEEQLEEERRMKFRTTSTTGSPAQDNKVSFDAVLLPSKTGGSTSGVKSNTTTVSGKTPTTMPTAVNVIGGGTGDIGKRSGGGSKNKGPPVVRGINKAKDGGTAYQKLSHFDRSNYDALETNFEVAFKPLSVPVTTIVDQLVEKKNEVKEKYRKQQEKLREMDPDLAAKAAAATKTETPTSSGGGKSATGKDGDKPISDSASFSKRHSMNSGKSRSKSQLGYSATTAQQLEEQQSTTTSKKIDDPLKGINSQVVMNRVSGFIGQQRSAQRRARRDYVPCLLKCLRDDKDLRSQFDSHIEKVQTDRKEAVQRAHSSMEKRRLFALGYSQEEIRSNSELSTTHKDGTVTYGKPKNFLSWNRRTVSSGESLAAEKERLHEKRLQHEDHRRQVYLLHQDLLMQEAVRKELSSIPTESDVGVSLSTLQRWRMETARRSANTNSAATNRSMRSLGPTTRPDSRTSTLRAVSPIENSKSSRRERDENNYSPMSDDTLSADEDDKVGGFDRTLREGEATATTVHFGPRRGGKSPTNHDDPAPHQTTTAAVGRGNKAFGMDDDDAEILLDAMDNAGTRNPEDLEMLAGQLAPEKRGSKWARDRRWVAFIYLVKSAKMLNQARVDAVNRGSSAWNEESLLVPGGVGGSGGEGAADLSGTLKFNPADHGGGGEHGSFLTVTRGRPVRQTYQPDRPEAMFTLLNTLKRNSSFVFWLRLHAAKLRATKIDIVANFLRFKFEQQKTVLYVKRYLKFCRLVIHKFVDSHKRQAFRVEGLAKQFDHYYHERLHYGRAVCGDAERKLQKGIHKNAMSAASTAAATQPGETQTPNNADKRPVPLSPEKLASPAAGGTRSATPSHLATSSPSKFTPKGLKSPGAGGGRGKKKEEKQHIPRIDTPEFSVARQIAQPLLQADLRLKKNGKLGPDPFSARLFALATLSMLNQDKAPKLNSKTKEYVVKLMAERKRYRYIKSVQEWVEQMKEAVLKHEALYQLASISAASVAAAAKSKKEQEEEGGKGEKTGSGGGSELAHTSSGNLVSPPPKSSLHRHLHNFTWPKKPYHYTYFQPNEVRLMVLTCYALGAQERKWAFEATRGLDVNSTEYQQQLAAIHKHVCSEKNVIDCLRQQYELYAKDKVSGIRSWFLEDIPVFHPVYNNPSNNQMPGHRH